MLPGPSENKALPGPSSNKARRGARPTEPGTGEDLHQTATQLKKEGPAVGRAPQNREDER